MYHGAFGGRLGRSFHLSAPPVLTSQTTRGIRLAVTELRIDQAGYGMTSPMGSDDAYLVCLNFRKQNMHELWCDGRSVCSTSYDDGTTYVLDLRQDPIAYVADPMHSLYFYVPRQAIVDMGEELGKKNVTGLSIHPGDCFKDEIVGSIGQALLPLFKAPAAFNQPLIDHLLQGLCAYLASSYAGSAARPEIVRGALAPWQQKLVVQMMQARVFEGVSVNELAEACGLSSGALARGFKKSTGMSPHQWLLALRVDLAIELLTDSEMSLADIAFKAGFSDQSHFSRVFTQKMGISPGAWRKSLANNKASKLLESPFHTGLDHAHPPFTASRFALPANDRGDSLGKFSRMQCVTFAKHPRFVFSKLDDLCAPRDRFRHRNPHRTGESRPRR